VTIVSNTSPITNLAAIAQLDLLYQLYGTILIPQAVYAVGSGVTQLKWCNSKLAPSHVI